VSTLDRIPVYFGLNWGIGALWQAERSGQPAAEGAPEPFQAWFDSFQRINRIRAKYPEVKEGETRFDCLEVSSASVVHYLRHLRNRDSVILLNADKEPQTFTVKITRPEILKISREKGYRITNLMTEDLVRRADGAPEWSGREIIDGGFAMSLKGYEGAVLKVLAVARP
jgi:hypothetical protein